MLSSPVVERVVIDTNIFVSALMNAAGAPRAVLRLALNREVLSVIGNALFNALFNEYESLLKRDNLWKDSLLKGSERARLFDALLRVSAWTPIYYLWRPNLRDESDNHLIELAVAAGAETIITANKRDFADSELLFPTLRIETAGEFLDQRKTIWAH